MTESGYCPDNLLESQFIKELIDGNDEWLGVRVGVTTPEDVSNIISDRGFDYSSCVEIDSEETCEPLSSNVFANGRGILKISFEEFYQKEFWFIWDDGYVQSVGFRWDNCLTVDSVMSEIDSIPYMSAIVSGLHETQITPGLIYPTYGLSVGIEPLSIEKPIISAETKITFINLYPPVTSIEEQSDEAGFIASYDVHCARQWQGFGNLFDLYYPDATGTTCPYTSP
jgi:hypothetical protein